MDVQVDEPGGWHLKVQADAGPGSVGLRFVGAQCHLGGPDIELAAWQIARLAVLHANRDPIVGVEGSRALGHVGIGQGDVEGHRASGHATVEQVVIGLTWIGGRDFVVEDFLRSLGEQEPEILAFGRWIHVVSAQRAVRHDHFIAGQALDELLESDFVAAIGDGPEALHNPWAGSRSRVFHVFIARGHSAAVVWVHDRLARVGWVDIAIGAGQIHVGRPEGDDRRSGVAHGDGLHAAGGIAAAVRSNPGAPDGVVAGAVARDDGVAAGDFDLTAVVSRFGRAGGVRIGRGGAVEGGVGRAGDGRRSAILNRYRLHAAGGVAAAVGGSPGAGNDVVAGAVARGGAIAAAEGEAAAVVGGGG